MAKITFDMPPGPIKEHFKRFGDRSPGALRKGLELALMRFEDRFVRKRLSGHGSGSLGRRTGQLARSLKREVTGITLRELKGKAFFAVPEKLKDVPWVHEEGATIRPKSAKFLTVPLEAAMTPAGKLRGTASEYIEGQISVPKIDDTFFGRSDEGRLFLFGVKVMKGRKADKLIPLFHLVKQVTIPKRLHFVDEFRKFFGPAGRGIKIIAAEWAKFIAGFGGKA